jgi:hypothetical protein
MGRLIGGILLRTAPGETPRLYLRRARAAKENRNKAAKASKKENINAAPSVAEENPARATIFKSVSTRWRYPRPAINEVYPKKEGYIPRCQVGWGRRAQSRKPADATAFDGVAPSTEKTPANSGK